MFNNPYMYTRFVPNVYSSIPVNSFSSALRGSAFNNGLGTMARGGAIANVSRSGGLFSKLGGVFSSFRSFNWGGLINNASKTLGVINQTIPLVKQAGPMFRNMRSIMKLASVFKDETDPPKFNNTEKVNILPNEDREIKKETTSQKESVSVKTSNYDSSTKPIFFVN